MINEDAVKKITMPSQMTAKDHGKSVREVLCE